MSLHNEQSIKHRKPLLQPGLQQFAASPAQAASSTKTILSIFTQIQQIRTQASHLNHYKTTTLNSTYTD